MNDLKNSDLLKSHLIIKINFKFSTDSNEEHVMHSKGDDTDIMYGKEKNKVFKYFFKSFPCRYQKELGRINKRHRLCI